MATFLEHLATLKSLSANMDAGVGQKKSNLIYILSTQKIPSAKALLEYHHLLLFISGYSQSKEIYTCARLALLELKETVKQKYPGWETALSNTGIANTDIRSTYSFDALDKMNSLFGKNISLLSIDSKPQNTETILNTVLPAVTRNEWNNHHLASSTAQVKKLGRKDSLHWLLQTFRNAEVDGETRDYLFDALEVFSKWKVEKGITQSRSLEREPFIHREEFIRQVDLSAVLKDAKYKTYSLSENDKSNLENTALEVLAALLRETDPVTYADSRYTELFDMGRGFDIALFTMQPQRRLALESYIGYVGFKNRVPIAYGGAWITGNYARIGINIFPWFRGGESAWIFAQLMRIYHQEYNVKCFNVEPYQIGKNNSDGIKSGAFWFYYRMGYRPQQKDLAVLAEKEFAKILANKKYRSPSSTLLQLANARMLLEISKTSHNDSAFYSEAIRNFVTENYNGDFNAAQQACFLQIMKYWNIKEKFSANEKKWFLQYSLLLAIIPGSAKWSAADRKTFIQMVKEKAEGSEKEFVRLWQGSFESLVSSL